MQKFLSSLMGTFIPEGPSFPPAICNVWAEKGFKTLDMIFYGLVDMFEGDFADTCIDL